ncbi:MAG TPA: ABC transporter permease [Candidatus Limnocylindrales bacterium]|nr:ABC transporter permease [Candidatus Limnocylindrales bacterium]
MDTFLQQIVSGLATGGIYASLALALVMIYQATDVVNFAQGEMAMFSTYLAWSLLNAGVPYWIAFFSTLAIAFIGGLLIERTIIRPMENAPVLSIVIVCIGLLVIFNSLAGWIYSYVIQSFPSPFPRKPLKIGNIVFGLHDLGIIGITLILLIFLYLFFKYTSLGLAMRAAAQNPVSSRLVGIRVSWMLALGWGLAAMIGAVAGMMIAPIVFLEPNMMGGIMIYAFAAATLGGFNSPLGAVIGGILVGITENLAGTYIPFIGTDLKLTVALMVILMVLLVKPTGLFGKARIGKIWEMKRTTQIPEFAGVGAPSIPSYWKMIGLLGVLTVAVLLPFVVSSYRLFQFTMAYVYAIALLGLNMLTGYNGQISLGHGAFYALGAYTTAILIERGEMAYGWTIPIASFICLITGFLFGIPALRLEGLYLSLATFALALSIPQILKYFESWTGGVQGIILSKPEVPFGLSLNPDQWLYFLVLGILVISFGIGWNLLRGRVGRAIIAIRDHPIAAETLGIPNALYKSLTFGVSAMYTGTAGALGALVVQFVAPDSFNEFLSISFLVGIVIGGLSSISGALFGAFFIQFVPTYAQNISKAAPWAIYGIFLIVFMYVMPTGIAGFLQKVWGRLGRFRRK